MNRVEVLLLLIGVIYGGFISAAAWLRNAARLHTEAQWRLGFIPTEGYFIGEEIPSLADDEPTIRTWIWTPKRVYRAGEKVPLYIETEALKRVIFEGVVSPIDDWPYEIRVRLLAGPEEPPQISFFIPSCGLSRPAVTRVLRVRRNRGVLLFKPAEYWPKLRRHQWLPFAGASLRRRIHGKRLLCPRKKEVLMQPGDSILRCIPDLFLLFVTRETLDGRKLILGGAGNWLPMEGRYRVQFHGSNIIEFQVRR